MFAALADDAERLSYRAYVTELMRLQGEGKTLTVRWLDIVQPPPEDNRTAEEIVDDVMRRAGLTLADD